MKINRKIYKYNSINRGMKERGIKVPTLVKWAGGKKQLLKQFESLFPKQIKRYFEPFVGGGGCCFLFIKNSSRNKKDLPFRYQ